MDANEEDEIGEELYASQEEYPHLTQVEVLKEAVEKAIERDVPLAVGTRQLINIWMGGRAEPVNKEEIGVITGIRVEGEMKRIYLSYIPLEKSLPGSVPDVLLKSLGMPTAIQAEEEDPLEIIRDTLYEIHGTREELNDWIVLIGLAWSHTTGALVTPEWALYEKPIVTTDLRSISATIGETKIDLVFI